MAMFIVCKTLYDMEKNPTLQVYIGGLLPAPQEMDRVLEVQADGDELAYILRRFNNLPSSNNPSMRWFGDMAKFIVANLKW